MCHWAPTSRTSGTELGTLSWRLKGLRRDVAQRLGSTRVLGRPRLTICIWRSTSQAVGSRSKGRGRRGGATRGAHCMRRAGSGVCERCKALAHTCVCAVHLRRRTRHALPPSFAHQSWPRYGRVVPPAAAGATRLEARALRGRWAFVVVVWQPGRLDPRRTDLSWKRLLSQRRARVTQQRVCRRMRRAWSSRRSRCHAAPAPRGGTFEATPCGPRLRVPYPRQRAACIIVPHFVGPARW